MSHRRRHTRLQGQGMASHLRVDGELVLGLPVENISLGGMFVACDAPLPAGTRMTLELLRPGMDRSLKLGGRVVGSIPYDVAARKGLRPGMGIRFENMEPEVAERLRDVLLGLTVPTSTDPESQAEPGALSFEEPHPSSPPETFPEFNPVKLHPEIAEARLRAFDFGFVTLADVKEPEDFFGRPPSPLPERPRDEAASEPAPVPLQVQTLRAELEAVRAERDALARMRDRLEAELIHARKWSEELEAMVRELQGH